MGRTYPVTALTGGGSALDGISREEITNGDRAQVQASSVCYEFMYDATCTEAEDPPRYIRPDDYTSAGVWVLQSFYVPGATESVAGLIAKATQALAEGGTDDDAAITSLKLALAFAAWFPDYFSDEMDSTLVSQAAAEAGASADPASWSPLRVKQAIDALASGGGSSTGTNLIFNSDFQFGQLGTSFTGASWRANNDSTMTLDGWRLLSDGNDIVVLSQDTSVKPARAYGSCKLEVATANKKFGIVQVLEARDAAKIIGGQASVSWEMRTTTGAVVENVRAALLAWDGTADSVTADPVSAWNAEGANPTWVTNWTAENTPADIAVTADAFARHTIEAVDIDTSGAKNVALVLWVDDTDCAVGDVLYVSKVQVEEGATATDYTPVDAATDFERCQRRVFTTYGYGVTPGTAVTAGTFFFTAYDANTIYHGFHFPVQMLFPPTIVLYTIGGTAGAVGQVGVGDVTGVVAENICTSGFASCGKTGGFTGGSWYAWHFYAEAQL